MLKMRLLARPSFETQLNRLSAMLTSLSLFFVLVAVYFIGERNATLSKIMGTSDALPVFAAAFLLVIFLCLLTVRNMAGQRASDRQNLLRQIRQKLQTAGQPDLLTIDELGSNTPDLLLNIFDRLLAERSDANRSSQSSKERLRLIVDSIPALIAHIDVNQNIIMASPGYETAYQISPQSLAGEHVRKLLGDDVFAQSTTFMQEALAGKATSFERLVTHTGSLRWERVSYMPEFNVDGSVAGFISLAEDITEFKRAQHTFARSEMRLRMITDNIPALIAYIDCDEHYIFCNGRYETMLGLAPDKILGQSMRHVAGETAYRDVENYVCRVLRGEKISFESCTTGKFFHTDFIPDIDANEQVVGFYSMVLDITDRKQAELRQQTSEQLLRSVTDNLPALISYIDTDERFQFNNLPYEKWFGRPLSEITGQHVATLLSPEDYVRHQLPYAQALAGQKAEFEFTSTQGDQARVFQVAYLPQAGADDKPTGVCVMINDITALKQVENQLRILARFDTLTGLPNRNHFDEKLAEAILRSRRTGQPVALMFLDIDHFKSINDTLGHHAGDDVLREFALRLTSSVRQTDTVARLAGDEFVIVLEGLNLAQQSATVAQKIIDTMRDSFDVLGSHRHVTTSIGIAIGQADEADGNELLQRADAALYEAKAAGRNRFCVSA